MAEALAKKKRIRAGHRASATKFTRQIEEVLAGDTPDKERLSLLRMNLSEKLEVIKTLDSEVIELIEDEEALATEIEQADGYKETIFSALIRIDRATKSTSSLTDPATTPATDVRATPTTASSKRVRLPKMQLRSFGGDPTKWTSFWESFEAAVHDNSELSDIEKFNYLNSLLERSARDAVSGLSLTAANYKEAVETLHKRFGSKQQIVNKHMDALLQVEAVTSSHNTKALRRQFDNIGCHIRSLKSLGIDSESYGSLLCPVLLSKIPSDLQLIVSRKVSESDWSLDQLMEAIEEELIARERVSASQGRSTPRRSEHNTPPTATTLVSGDNSGMQTPCCYCDQLHAPNDCTTVREVDARKQLLRRAGRCFSCLRKGHLGRDCRSKSRCRVCKGRHHTSICGSSPLSGSGSRQAPPQPSGGVTLQSPPAEAPTTCATTTHSTLNPSAPTFPPPATSTSLCAASDKVILLQTALANVSSPHDRNHVLRVRIVMDSGSQRSYLTQRVKDRLSLPVTNEQRLSIAAFGSRRGQPRQCEVVRLIIATKSGINQELELLVVPHICDPLTTQNTSTCSKKYDHIAHLNLADISEDDTLEVDLLIGSDYYWQFVTGKTIRGSDGPVAIETTLGWVLSGPAQTTGVHGSSVSLTTTHTLRVEGITNRELDATLRRFWELESLGILTPDSDPVSDQFTGTIQMKGGRYEVALPWREYHDPLPDNLT